MFAVLAVIMVTNRFGGEGNDWKTRSVQTLATVFSMSMAWTMLFFGKWSFWLIIGTGDFVVAQIVMAFAFSFGGFFLIIVFAQIADRIRLLECALRFLGDGISLLI